MDLAAAKLRGRRLTMVTAYSAPMARHVAAAGADLLLVGDSLGMVELGHATTTPVTVDDMVHAATAVRRGLTSAAASAASAAAASSSEEKQEQPPQQQPMVVVDLPFGSYELGPAQALATAHRLVKEAGADAVKLEGGKRDEFLLFVQSFSRSFNRFE